MMPTVEYTSAIPFREPLRRYSNPAPIDVHQVDAEAEEHRASAKSWDAAKQEYIRLLGLLPPGFSTNGGGRFTVDSGCIIVTVKAHGDR